MIDWSRVAELRDEIGDEDFAEVMESFLEEVKEALGHLSGLPQDGLGPQLHYLKGCALNLGFLTFADLCLWAEAQAARGATVDAELRAIAAAFTESRRIFLAEWPARIAA